jgi:hypothetical protein
MKTLNDIKQDMSTLYDELRTGTIDIKLAGELANVAGKFLKAEQLELAKEVFLDTRAIPRTLDPARVALLEQH